MDHLPFFKSIEIDATKKYSPARAVNMSTTKHSDHFPVIITFENIPKRKAPRTILPTLILFGTLIMRMGGKSMKP